jgi:hypothetical protein
MSAALDSRDRRAVEHLLAHCAALSLAVEPDSRRPVFDRLRDAIGVEFTRFLLFGLTRAQRARSPLRPLGGTGASAP